ncbi:hypothetical protein [Deinococcus multiflagellatus]|uniref:Helicase HerA central domain-containing protein n=1 Tax=Deinococcus multiflagellatus TaxID=1656887 RepID=A0ABW1ZQT2_9DEIO|nr:hypothetical protein [Deinococcus multiflagellatus]MBZ9715837.1 hypothetical protein [Deinococcus multiflagellatus]
MSNAPSRLHQEALRRAHKRTAQRLIRHLADLGLNPLGSQRALEVIAALHGTDWNTLSARPGLERLPALAQDLALRQALTRYGADLTEHQSQDALERVFELPQSGLAEDVPSEPAVPGADVLTIPEDSPLTMGRASRQPSSRQAVQQGDLDSTAALQAPPTPLRLPAGAQLVLDPAGPFSHPLAILGSAGAGKTFLLQEILSATKRTGRTAAVIPNIDALERPEPEDTRPPLPAAVPNHDVDRLRDHLREPQPPCSEP